jgi:GH24 family phage-related lysozyme (muramidase)
MVNSGDYEGAGREFSRWVKGSVNGRTIVLRGLVKRRTAEYTLWNTPVTSATQTINIEALKKLTKE